MKKFWIFILIILLLGACDNEEVIDDSNYNLDAKYNVVYGDSNSTKNMDYSEDSLLAFPAAFSFAEMGQGAISGYIEDNKFYEMELDASSTCSLYDALSCEGIIYSNVWPLYYYKGKLYSLVENERNPETNALESYIIKYDLDGKNSKNIMKVNKGHTNAFGTYTSSLQFHRNKIYGTITNSLFIADLNDKEMNKVDLEGVNKVVRIILEKDTLYVYAEQYNDGNEAHFNVVLECDLDGNIKELLYEDKNMQFIDERFLFYLDNTDGVYATAVLDRNTGETKIIDGNVYGFILKNVDTYLLDTAPEPNGFIVMNADGIIMHNKKMEYSETEWPQVYLGDRYYIYKKIEERHVTSGEMSGTIDIRWFGYYEISDDGISDLIMLDMPEGE